METLVSTRETMGDEETFKALISGTMSGRFVETEAIRLGPQGLSNNSLTEVIIPNVAEFAGPLDGLDITTLEVSTKFTASNGLVRYCDKLESLILRRSSTNSQLNQDSIRGTPIAAGEGAVYTERGYVSGWDNRINGTAQLRRLSWTYVNVYPLDRYPVTDFSSISDSWADIVAAVNGGTYADRYSIGDVKRLDLLDGTCVYMQLVGMDLDPIAGDSSTKAAMTWILRGVCRHRRQLHGSTATSIAWSNCDLRTWLNDELLEEFPSILRRNIKTVRKVSRCDFDTSVSNNETPSGETSVSEDKVWIPSYWEMDSYDDWRDDAPLFSTGITYFNPGGARSVTYGGISYSYFMQRSAPDYQGARYWLRDKIEGTNATFVTSPYRYKSGESSYTNSGRSYDYATVENYVVFGFCI